MKMVYHVHNVMVLDGHQLIPSLGECSKIYSALKTVYATSTVAQCNAQTFNDMSVITNCCLGGIIVATRCRYVMHIGSNYTDLPVLNAIN